MAARAEPMAKVMEMVRFTSMPMSWAAALSSEQARMALPILVRPVKRVRPTMMTMHTTTVRMVSAEMDSPPGRESWRSRLSTGVNILGLEDQSSWAAFWRK